MRRKKIPFLSREKKKRFASSSLVNRALGAEGSVAWLALFVCGLMDRT